MCLMSSNLRSWLVHTSCAAEDEGWADIVFNVKELACCMNPMSWDPHVARLSRSGPRISDAAGR